MARPAPKEDGAPHGYTAEEYFALATLGAIGPDDRVELLRGVVVAMAPQNPGHASAVAQADTALRRVAGSRASVRVQLPLVAASDSVPEPDVAVVPGGDTDYADAHPTTALLVVEVADSSLIQDRLTKASIYAAAGIPEYWLVNLRDDQVEVFRAPDRTAARYAEYAVARRGEQLEIVAMAGARVSVEDFLPKRA